MVALRSGRRVSALWLPEATSPRYRKILGDLSFLYERKYWGELTGNGYFFSPEYIERWRPSNVRFLVASNVPGITWSGKNRRMSSGFSSLTCSMKIFVDGFEWGRWPNIPWSQVAGVDVYKDPATLWAEFGDASSEEAVVSLERGAAHEVQLGLLFGEMTTGRVVGQVRDARTHRPVVAAEIAVGSRAAVVQSNRTGRFVLSGLPVGEHELSFRHIGFSPLTQSVTVTRGHTTEVDARLTPDPVELEPLVATATRPRRLEIGDRRGSRPAVAS